MSRLCQRCQKPVEFAEVLVSLPPHDPVDLKKVCFECGLLLVAEYNEALGNKTKNVLLIQPKKDVEDEDL